MSKFPAQSPRGFWYRFIAGILRPILLAATARDWRGGQYLRIDRGIVVAMNHLSWYDPLVAAHFVNDNGRPVRFLAKVEVFKIPLLGALLKSAGQIPVQRGNSDAAAGSLRAAFSAIEDKQCVVIYPEGTLTRDPQLWPMTAKTGAARIALMTGAPVIPAAQWGPQEVLAPYSKRLRLFPRKTMHVWAGPEVDLDDLRALPVSAATLREATERIMRDITKILATQRNEVPPAVPLDRRIALQKKADS
ncbi:MAG: lysophospholipid acyltransferase family protein [Actinomycetes bacterium]